MIAASSSLGQSTVGIFFQFDHDPSPAVFAAMRDETARLMAPAGALVGIFVGVAISNRKEAKYRDYIQRGGVRLTVRCPNGSLLEQASQILRDSGASELGVTTSTRSPMSGS